MADEEKKVAAPETPPAEKPKEPSAAETQARLKALEEQNAKQKKSIDAASADAAEWKRKYRATLDEAERAKQEQADKIAEYEGRIAEYEAKERANSYFTKLVAAGYDADTATSMAGELPPNVPDSFFERQKAFLDNQKQAAKAQAINSQPGLSAGMPPSTTDAANAKEISDMRRWIGLK